MMGGAARFQRQNILAAIATAYIAAVTYLARNETRPETIGGWVKLLPGIVLLAGAFAWLAGNLSFAAGAASHAVLPWWFAFLVMTIAAERLEMTRLRRRRPAAPAGAWGWGGGKSKPATVWGISDKDLFLEANEVLAQKKVHFFIFGHRHLPIDFRLTTESRYINLGEWINYQTYAVFDGTDLELKSFTGKEAKIYRKA